MKTFMPIRKYGWKKQDFDARDFKFVPNMSLALPELVDLRPQFPEAYDQSKLGSCTSQAIAALVQYTTNKLGHFQFMPSRLFIYYNERDMENTVDEDAGAQIRDGMKVVNWLGVPKEELHPYVIENFAQKPSDAAYKNAREHIVTKYEAVEQDGLQMQTCLASGNPIVFGFMVFSSFESKEVAETGIMPIPRVVEDCLGGHAVLIVGYDLVREVYIVRNSWSKNWGDNGYFYMPFEFAHNANLCSDFWTMSFVTNHS